MKTKADAFIKDAEENGVEVDPENAPGYKMTVEQITQQQLESDDKAVDVDGDNQPDRRNGDEGFLEDVFEQKEITPVIAEKG